MSPAVQHKCHHGCEEINSYASPVNSLKRFYGNMQFIVDIIPARSRNFKEVVLFANANIAAVKTLQLTVKLRDGSIFHSHFSTSFPLRQQFRNFKFGRNPQPKAPILMHDQSSVYSLQI